MGANDFTVNNSGASSFTGVISGTAALTKSGAGTLTLGGANTYSGGTTVSAGTLQGTSTSLQGTISNASAVVFNQDFDGTYAGVISEAGALTKSGSGTVILTGVNTYTGNTNINTGTLSLNTTGTLSSTTPVVISSGATLDMSTKTASQTVVSLSSAGSIVIGAQPFIVSNASGNSSTSTGIISGSSDLTKSGAGTLSLSGPSANTYTGNTNIVAGTLQIDADNKLGISSGTIDFTNGTLKASSNIISSRDITTSTLATFNTNSNNINLHGVISGLGGLTKTGNGTLYLPTSHTYTGDTTVSGGTLNVNGTLTSDVTTATGGIFSGNATVNNLTNNGIVKPGNSIGTITIPGDYTQTASGTLINEVDATPQTDLLAVTGTANLAGTLTMSPLSGSHYKGTEYIIITAGTAVSGQFSTVNSDTPDFYVTVSYLTNSVVVTLLEHQFFSDKNISTYDPRQVELYLERIPITNNPELIDIIAVLDDLDLNGLTDALDKMQPAAFSAFYMLNSNNNHLVSSIVNRVPYYDERCCPIDCIEKGRMSFFIEPFYSYVDVDKRDQLVGFNSKATGAVGGVEKYFLGHTKLGLAIGTNYSHLGWDQDRGHSHIWSYFGTAFGSVFHPCFHINTSLLGGWNHYDTKRHIQYTGLDKIANSTHTGYNLAAHIDAGYNLLASFNHHLQPFVEADYSYLHEESYLEKNADSLNLDIKNKNSNVLRTEAGVRVFTTLPVECVCFKPMVWLSWIFEQPFDKNYTSGFENEPQTLHSHGYHTFWSRGSTGIDLVCLFKHGELTMKYTYDAGKDFMSHKGEFNIKWNF